jgi:recombinational DNA repair protein (RecF pathway)
LKAIVLSKTKFKERDVICHLLTANGGQISCLFYGGAGGGKKMKPSILEVGYLIDVTIAQKKNEIVTELLMAKEYQASWSYTELRLNHHAFYLLCFYLEIIQKIARPLDSGELDVNEPNELFTVLSNAIYYLEQDSKNIQKNKNRHLSLFLTKLSHAMGVFPETDSCIYCDVSLNDAEAYALLRNEGRFACSDCLSQKEDLNFSMQSMNSSKQLRSIMVKGIRTLYKDHDDLHDVTDAVASEILDYLFYQFHFQKHQFKTLRMIF